jgi:hypothetical protein
LNAYSVFLGDPGYFEKDLDRYRNATRERLREAAALYLNTDACVMLSVVPRGRADAAARDSRPVVLP